MMLRATLLVFAWLATAPAPAQDAADTDADETAEAQPAPDASDTESEEATTPAADDESYLDIEEEDFRPSEEIPTDQSISFPTDI